MAYKVTFTIQKTSTDVSTQTPAAEALWDSYLAAGKVIEGNVRITDDPLIFKNEVIFEDETAANTYFAELEALPGGSGLNGHTILDTTTETI